MKKIFIPLLLLALVAITISSCAHEEAINPSISDCGNAVSFSAVIGVDQPTKTTFNNQTLELFWSLKDTVSIWHKEADQGAGNIVTYEASEAGVQTNLVVVEGGTPLQWGEGDNTFAAIYVGEAVLGQTNGSDFTIALPAAQVQSQANNTDHVGNYMAMKGFLATTHTGTENVDNVNIHFSPLYSVLEFAFPYDENKTVTQVEAEVGSTGDDQVLAFGTAKVSKNDNSTVISDIESSSNKVTLTFTTPMNLSNGVSKAWMIVKPGTYESITFTYTYSNGRTQTKIFTNVTIARCTRYCITTYGSIVNNTANGSNNAVNTLEQSIKDQLHVEDVNTITDLKVTGTMNQADFATLKNMSYLTTLDLSDVTVVGTININYDMFTKEYQTQDGNAIPYQALFSHPTLKNFLLPKGITTIGQEALAYCLNLTGVLTIPDGVMTIEQSAFRSCDFIGSLTIPSTVTIIEDYAFWLCGFTGTLTIPSTVTTIKNNAFQDCGFTGTLTIPSTVTTIGASAFSGCTGFTVLSLNYTGADGSELPTYNTAMFPAQFVASGASGVVVVPMESIDTYRANNGWKDLNFSSVVNNSANSNTSISNLEAAIKTQFGDEALSTLTSLIVTGTMNQADFATLKNMNGLVTLDLSDVTVVGEIDIAESGDNQTQDGNAIPYQAFKDKTTLKGIGLPKNATTIGEEAFSGCTGLTNPQTLSEGVETIGKNAFYSCTGLTGTLTIPSTVTTIGVQAFYSCTGLTGTLTIPSTVTTIGASAFFGCTNLLTITLNYMLESEFPTYHTDMFPAHFVNPDATGIITVPAGSIGTYMAKNDWKNLNLVINNSAHSLNSISNLTDAIGTGALSTLTSLKIIGTMNQADFATLNGISALTTLDLTKVTVVGVIDIASEGDKQTQVGNAIPYEAFKDNTTLNSIKWPRQMTAIGEKAFSGCTALTGTLTIPSTVTTIGSAAFSNCSNLAGTLTIPRNVTTIGSAAFYNCSSFTDELKLPEGMVTIGDNAFYNCSGLIGVLKIPRTVTTIGTGAFSNCSGLLSLSLQYTGELGLELPTYQVDMFPSQFIDAELSGIVTVPNDAINIYNEKEGWKNLKIVKVVNNTANEGNNVSNTLQAAIKTACGENALSDLTSLKVTGTMNQADFATLNNMSALATLDLSDVTVVGLIKIGSVDPVNRTGLAIPYEAFKNNTNLKTILLPRTINTIGESAFQDCTGLTGNLTIPSTVTIIRQEAFDGCTGLTSLTLLWSSYTPTYTQSMLPNQFINPGATGIVKVLQGKKSMYMAKDGWHLLNIPQAY